jgi:hypothetical protein
MYSAFRFPLSAFRFPLSAFRFPLSALLRSRTSARPLDWVRFSVPRSYQ